jgi:deoxyribodipyrimidine photo-lyase
MQKSVTIGEMKIEQSRVRKLNEKEVEKGPVIYLMSRDQRVHDNWALLFAQKLALELQEPLVVAFCLIDSYQSANKGHYDFMLEGLGEIENEVEKLQIGFVKLRGGQRSKEALSLVGVVKAGAVICDFSPLRGGRIWREKLGKKADCAVFEVDAHNIVPCWEASQKQEYSARFFRPKIHGKLEKYLTEFPKIKKHPLKISSKSLTNSSWKGIESNNGSFMLDRPVAGERAAEEKMKSFIKNGLKRYHLEKNDPTKDVLSGLSPYLHFGQISAQRVALEMRAANAPSQAKETFLEELIVRKELSDNYCYYNKNYDNNQGLPDWAKKTLAEHKKDKREFIYDLSTFEEAKTHDDLWNAAQQEMIKSGKMHGYMRMYWAKKILEWSENAQKAQKIAIYLNDKYSLDGRDPNGYTGIAWSIGGVHDRPWFERPIFGKVRYMSYRGCQRKFDVEEYIKQVENL